MEGKEMSGGGGKRCSSCSFEWKSKRPGRQSRKQHAKTCPGTKPATPADAPQFSDDVHRKLNPLSVNLPITWLQNTPATQVVSHREKILQAQAFEAEADREKILQAQAFEAEAALAKALAEALAEAAERHKAALAEALAEAAERHEAALAEAVQHHEATLAEALAEAAQHHEATLAEALAEAAQHHEATLAEALAEALVEAALAEALAEAALAEAAQHHEASLAEALAEAAHEAALAEAAHEAALAEAAHKAALAEAARQHEATQRAALARAAQLVSAQASVASQQQEALAEAVQAARAERHRSLDVLWWIGTASEIVITFLDSFFEESVSFESPFTIMSGFYGLCHLFLLYVTSMVLVFELASYSSLAEFGIFVLSLLSRLQPPFAISLWKFLFDVGLKLLWRIVLRIAQRNAH